MCVTVVHWSRRLHVQINRVRLSATLFSVSLCRFFSCLVSFFFILTADPTGHALGSINILSLSPEFYFGKGISKPLDLHTGQAYDQKKNHKLSRHVPPLKQLNFFQCYLTSWQTTHSTPQTVLIYTQHPPVTHWRKLNLPFVHRLNHQYYYPKISTGFAPKK